MTRVHRERTYGFSVFFTAKAMGAGYQWNSPGIGLYPAVTEGLRSTYLRRLGRMDFFIFLDIVGPKIRQTPNSRIENTKRPDNHEPESFPRA